MLVRFELDFDALNFVEQVKKKDDDWYDDEARGLAKILNSLKSVTKELSSLEELRNIIASIEEYEYDMTCSIYLDNNDNSFVVIINFV